MNGKLNFGNISLIKLLPPYKESVLDAISCQHLRTVYDYLYLDLTINSQEVSQFYDHYGHLTLTGELLGSVYPGPNAQSSAVVMANWPAGKMTLPEGGCVQYFIKHKMPVVKSGCTESKEHILPLCYGTNCMFILIILEVQQLC